MRRSHLLHTLRISALLTGCLAVSVLAGVPYRPTINPANFSHVVNHPYFPLVPGTTTTFIEKEGGETREKKTTVTRETRISMGVKCVVVHETETLAGVPTEDNLNWFAQDKDGSVWCFGEASKELKSGGRIITRGSWEAGVGGAQPGIVMLGRLKVGERYRRNFLTDVAEDIGEVAALDEAVTVPFGSYQSCVRIREWSMLESGASKKWFARGIGLVRIEVTGGEVAMLVAIERK